MESSVLFENSDGTIVVVDIPRSIEEAQVLPGRAITRRIISEQPRETPWQIPESKKDVASHASPSVAVAELMALEAVKTALEEARGSYDGPWCLPRVTRKQPGESGPIPAGVQSHSRKHKSSSPTLGDDKEVAPTSPIIPDQSCYLLGTVESKREEFLRRAPKFDLVVLDPPWPSRSVKRKSDRYATAYGVEEARELLAQIPIAAHLNRDGLVAIWVTNKAAVADLLTEPRGIFEQWGLEFIGEWTWLKITSAGEPVLDIESAWRKPWERLLIARRRGSHILLPTSRKVILGVPDIHSRKPNLRSFFSEFLPKNYVGLEIFARNLTAGWWSWGNEVLFFQQEHHWVSLGST
ncbi:MT-A70-domain-containing protein [Nemania sp. FL0916]|nr:MT-A70-domain-containing protein [Nemania sp. FL0916]